MKHTLAKEIHESADKNVHFNNGKKVHFKACNSFSIIERVYSTYIRL